jgi:hypothetical protein
VKSTVYNNKNWIVLGPVPYFVIYLRSKRTGRWTLDDAPPQTPDEE